MRKAILLSVVLFGVLILPAIHTASDSFHHEDPSFWLMRRLYAEEPGTSEDGKVGVDNDGEKLQDIDLGETGLEDFVLYICHILDVQLVYDKQIFSPGKKYMFKFQPQPVDRLFPLLRDTLGLYGYRLLSIGDENKPVYFIFKKDQPATFKLPPPNVIGKDGKVRSDKIIVKFVKLKYADANYLVNQLKALTGVNPKSLQSYPATNEIAIIDFPDLVERYERLIRVRDVEEAKLKTVVMELRHVKSSLLLAVMKQHLAALAVMSDMKPQAGASAYRLPVEFTAVEEPNKIVFTAPEHEAKKIEDFIKKFDVEIKAPEKEVVTEFYPLKFIDIEEAAKAISEVFGSQMITFGNGEITDSVEPSGTQVKFTSPTLVTNGQAEEKKPNNFQLEDYEIPAVVVQTHTTSLVITTSRRVHKKIKGLLAALDKKTPQVYLDAALVSVAYDTDLTIATELSTVDLLRAGKQVFSAADFGLSTLTPVPGYTLSGRTGFRRGGLIFGIAKDHANVIPALIRLSRTTSKVNVISNPSVFADNNKEAVFTTQDQEPFSETKETTSGSTITTQGGVETAAIEIKIMPTIYEGNSLRLEISLKVEAFTAPPASPNLSPPKTSNVYTGTITVPDGKTIIVGGLVTTNDSVTETKVPILGDIPLLGYLFKSHMKVRDKSVLYIFITPKILRQPAFEDVEKLEQQRRKQLEELDSKTKKK